MRSAWFRIMLCLLMAVSVFSQSSAQTPSYSPDSVGEEPVSVALITYYPGSEVYELFGHTALRVKQGQRDMVFNYGEFDFNTPHFVYRFVKGETDYRCGGHPSATIAMGYAGRKIVEQVLNLTPSEARAVLDFLLENVRPENASYRYRIVSDNCATRPRDIIEGVLEGTLHYGDTGFDSVTYRQMMEHYDKNYPWQQFGIDLSLGCDIDTVITPRQQMFMPLALMNAVSGATVERDGVSTPLVKSTRVLQPGRDEGNILPPTPWWRTPLFLALLILAAAVAVTVVELRRRSTGRMSRMSRITDAAIFGVAGMMGCVIAFLVFFSTHEATTVNYNILWLHPLHLMVPALVWVKRASKILTIYHCANTVVLVLLLAGYALLPQTFNVAFFPLILTLLIRSAANVWLQWHDVAK